LRCHVPSTVFFRGDYFQSDPPVGRRCGELP
jgi:hypothetical protein